MSGEPGVQPEASASDGTVHNDGKATRLTHKPDSRATAEYILSMSGQLAKLAADAQLDLLAYLLDMVRIEAELARNRPSPTKGGTRRLA